MDTLGFIIAFEQGETDEQETIEGFQALIDSGIVWSLQGSYGRTAARLIEAGYCFRPGEQPKGSYLSALIEQNNPGQNERDEAESKAYRARFPESVEDDNDAD